MKYGAIICIVIFCFTGSTYAQSEDAAGECITCHKELTPGLYKQWYESSHSEFGITCIDCHGAEEDEPDAFEHNDTYIATLVTPADCGICHSDEEEQVSNSFHASAGEILDSDDAYLAMVVGGTPVAIAGCESCHGTKVKIDPDSPNMLSKESWPNSGIGRINPDGSKGSCNACHTRHGFSRAQARRPEACSKCHLGPDHPQKEIYEESKHGNAYYTNIDKMNMDADRWIVGVDYYDAPTCATCHMSATENMEITHDVGERIAWTLRPEISTLYDDWESRREKMSEVCAACHVSSFTEGHFYQYDAVVQLYNEKFAKPSKEIMDLIKSNGLLAKPAAFANKIEWTYWEMWHHEGRRGRQGAAMMGADYTWWNGIYDLAKNFYFKFIPEAKEFNDPEVTAYIDNLLNNDPMHSWMNRSTEELKNDIKSGRLHEIYKELFIIKK